MTPGGRQSPGGLPNASLIYGIAASVLGVVGLYLMLFGHKPFGGLLVILLAVCFMGFALHFLKYRPGLGTCRLVVRNKRWAYTDASIKRIRHGR